MDKGIQLHSGRTTSIRDLHLADAVLAAAVHAACFKDDPWPASAFSDLLTIPGTFGFLAFDAEAPLGFILCRVAADECEVLTVAVLETEHRRGIGGTLLFQGLKRAESLGARSVFLEVAVDNAAAIGLYRQAGFAKTAVRPGYYRRKSLPQRVDAAVMSLALDSRLNAKT